MSDWISKVIIAPPSAIDLTTLAIVKDELKIMTADTSNDAWLSRAITQASTLIANYCNRPFWPQRLTETQQIQQDPYPYQTPGGVMPLQLGEWPVVQLNSVTQTYPIATPNPLTLNTDFSLDTYKGWLQRLNPFTGVAVAWEALPTIIDYISGFGAIATETWTIPATPFQISPTQAATLSFIETVNYVIGGAILTPITGGTPTTGQYLLAFVNGAALVTFAAADTGLSVKGVYAYAVIPGDLVQAVLRMITLRFFQRNRDPMLMAQDQPGLGSQRWWIPDPSKMGNGGLPPEVAGLLAPYRVPVIA